MAATAVVNSIVPVRNFHNPSFSGYRLRGSKKFLVHLNSRNLLLSSILLRQSKREEYKRQVAVQAVYSDGGGRPSSASIFVGGFILGGIMVGTLGCVFAPQISRTLAAADKKDLMRKLPKFIYDEEKALEKTRKVLAEKIAQLNSAIDDVSAQLRADDDPNGAAGASDELEAAI